MTNCGYSDLGINLADMFQETKKVSLSLQKKQLMVFVANDKTCTSN